LPLASQEYVFFDSSLGNLLYSSSSLTFLLFSFPPPHPVLPGSPPPTGWSGSFLRFLHPSIRALIFFFPTPFSHSSYCLARTDLPPLVGSNFFFFVVSVSPLLSEPTPPLCVSELDGRACLILSPPHLRGFLRPSKEFFFFLPPAFTYRILFMTPCIRVDVRFSFLACLATYPTILPIVFGSAFILLLPFFSPLCGSRFFPQRVSLFLKASTPLANLFSSFHRLIFHHLFPLRSSWSFSFLIFSTVTEIPGNPPRYEKPPSAPAARGGHQIR